MLQMKIMHNYTCLNRCSYIVHCVEVKSFFKSGFRVVCNLRQWTSGWESCSFELRCKKKHHEKDSCCGNICCVFCCVFIVMIVMHVCVYLLCVLCVMSFWDRFCRIHSLKTNSNSSEKHAEIQNAKLPWFAKHQFATGELLVSILRQDKLRLTSEIATGAQWNFLRENGNG